MNLIGWAREKLFRHPRDLYREAIEATDETTVQLRSMREQLLPYALERDGFAAIMRKHVAAEAYEQPQVAQIHRGPP